MSTQIHDNQIPPEPPCERPPRDSPPRDGPPRDSPPRDSPPAGSGPDSFHPAVATWFRRRFPGGPTPAQAAGWPAVATGGHTLIAAPTGSGKTLAAFLVTIDSLYRAAERGEAADGATSVVYVSPLKALGVDVAQNLQDPLAEISAVATEMGLAAPALRAEVRNGDTPASVRSAMARRPPQFLVTTPESLYLLVTSASGRANLASVRWVIVDEIHALARDKRGSHLSLTLERLARLSPRPPQRIGLSATQRPVSTIARLLVGSGPGRSGPAGEPTCSVVDVGHRRHLELSLELPDDELAAVAPAEQVSDIMDRVAAHVTAHRTTLVFVNTRRQSERLAHMLAERLGDEAVAAHHGSLSRDRRLRVEERLRAGELRALVATASLELGIDVGPVDLVCQIGSPRSLATFIQRVGRSGHTLSAVPRGILYPTTRDELVECAALLAGVRRGELDAVRPPVAPLDILAQQAVAECSAQRWAEDDLYDLFRQAAPFADLERGDFDDVVGFLADGVATGRGRRGAHLHRDRVNGTVAGRRGARLAALTSGGAIPELGEYRVVAEPGDTFVGTVNEDWAIESMAGDVFLLGSTSWRIRRVEPGTVRVIDAAGAPPSVPFWLGEAPARTDELSAEVSALRSLVAGHLDRADRTAALGAVQASSGLDPEAAAMVVDYLGAARAALGCLPTATEIVLERFFDETGGMQLVVHCPLGARVNRALGLALRKRFCVSFDFELQAAANDDAVLLSLGPQHSFPLESVTRFLSPATVGDVLRQAVLASPMFAARWRWNLNRSLAVLRYRGGRKNPAPIQRMEADDLMAAVFPALAACQENAGVGPIPIPDHPLVRQTLHDCLHEAMDVDGLRTLLAGIGSGEVTVRARDTIEPSPLAHEILNGRPFTFLDDAPLEERRSRAVPLRRGLPFEASDLASLDPAALARVREEVAPDPRDQDELHDLLLSLIILPERQEWSRLFEGLVSAGRALTAAHPAGPLWFATERGAEIAALLGGTSRPGLRGRGAACAAGSAADRDEAAAAALRGHLDVLGPVTAGELAAATALPPPLVATALGRLESEGFAIRGRFDPGEGPDQVCARRLLARIHHYSRRRRRASVRPVSAQDYMRFVLSWHNLAQGKRLTGEAGVLAAVEQLQGFEAPSGTWEESILPARVAGYRPEWVDRLGVTGLLAWGRLGLRAPSPADRAGARSTASRATPVSLVLRDDLVWLLAAARGGSAPELPEAGATREVVDAIAAHGALFRAELATATRRLPTDIDSALWDGVARGLLTADGFGSLRSLLAARANQAPRRRRLRHGARASTVAEGRWSLLATPQVGAAGDPPATVWGPGNELHDLAEAVAEQLLARWGVVWRDILARETLALPWREVLMALRRMEARGTALGGRFVTGFAGEQYALPEAADRLAATSRREGDGRTVRISAADPLNLTGIVVPGERVPAVRTRHVAYRDGLPVQLPATAPLTRGA